MAKTSYPAEGIKQQIAAFYNPEAKKYSAFLFLPCREIKYLLQTENEKALAFSVNLLKNSVLSYHNSAAIINMVHNYPELYEKAFNTLSAEIACGNFSFISKKNAIEMGANTYCYQKILEQQGKKKQFSRNGCLVPYDTDKNTDKKLINDVIALLTRNMAVYKKNLSFFSEVKLERKLAKMRFL